MQKIISLFQRNYEGDRLVRDEVVLGSEWVLANEGKPTVKVDGTACAFIDGILFKRYDAKPGRVPPLGWIPAQEPDPVTGHHPGWVTVGSGPEDKWHREAWTWAKTREACADGTYELVGPKFQGNPYGCIGHMLVRHGEDVPATLEQTSLLRDANPRDFDGIRDFLARQLIEGIVWHHPDGRMVKIKARDYGLAWPR